MAGLEQDSRQPAESQSGGEHPLLTLAKHHHEQATQGVMFGHFNAVRELRDPRRMLVVYRKRYGAGVVSDEYFVAQPTYLRDLSGQRLRPGETIVLDFDGTPAVAVVEALLYRRLLQDDPAAQTLVSRYLANHG